MLGTRYQRKNIFPQHGENPWIWGRSLLQKIHDHVPTWGKKIKSHEIWHQPKQCIVIREIRQNHHRFVLFDFSKIGIFIYPWSWKNNETCIVFGSPQMGPIKWSPENSSSDATFEDAEDVVDQSHSGEYFGHCSIHHPKKIQFNRISWFVIPLCFKLYFHEGKYPYG